MTLTSRRDAEEQVDSRVIDALRAVDREAHDAEYEASTPGAGRWRERIGAPRHDHGPTAGEISDDEVLGADARTTRLAQRHSFGRALDLPPVNREARGDWLVWLVLAGLVIWAIGAAAIWWLS